MFGAIRTKNERENKFFKTDFTLVPSKKSLSSGRENIRSFQSGRSEGMKLDVYLCCALNEKGPFQEDGHLTENEWSKNNEVSSFLVVMILAA